MVRIGTSIHFADWHRLTWTCGLAAVLLGLKVVVDSFVAQSLGHDPRLSDKAAHRHSKSQLRGLVRRLCFTKGVIARGGAQLLVGVHLLHVPVKLVMGVRGFDDDKLGSMIDWDPVCGHVHKGHVSIAIDRTVEKTSAIGSQRKFDVRQRTYQLRLIGAQNSVTFLQKSLPLSFASRLATLTYGRSAA